MSNMQTPKVICLYRVSSMKQVEYDEQKQADIPMQRKACREYAMRMGWEIVGEEQETGVSGYKTPTSNRDALMRIQEKAKKGKFDILLVFMFDRIGRLTSETYFVVEWFANMGIRVVSVMEGEQRFEQHSDKLLNYIRYWLSEGESQKISMRTRTRMAQITQEGNKTGGCAPYGYRYETGLRTNRLGKPLLDLIVDEVEAETVRQMFELFVYRQYGPQRISTYLYERHIFARSGKNWHPSSIRGILRNPTYIGILRFGDAQSKPLQHLQIVADDVYEAAQARINSGGNPAGGAERRSLLSGLIYCGHCGSRLTSTSSVKSYTKKNGAITRTTRHRYSCYGKLRRQTECDGQTGYNQEIIDEAVISIVHDILRQLNTVEPDESHLYRNQQRLAALQDERKQLNQEHAAIQTNLDILCMAKEKTDISMQKIKNIFKNVAHQKDMIEARLKLVRTEIRAIGLTIRQLRQHSIVFGMPLCELFDMAEQVVQRLIIIQLVKSVSLLVEYCVDTRNMNCVE